jgi:hypothetical protein
MPLMNNLGIAQADGDDSPNQPQQIVLPSHYPPHFANTLFSTPIKQRLETAHPANEQSKIMVDKLTQLLQKELEHSRLSGPDFIPFIFPDKFLPIPIDDKLFKTLASAKVWDRKQKKLFSTPSSHSEDHIAAWLN